MDDEAFLQLIRASGDVATILQRLRESQDLTFQEVADLAGLSKTYCVRLEHGERVPERDTLIALCLASFSLPVPQANRVLLLAGYAPLHHVGLARKAA
jgi:transcriptional regulator with XRE-family HTH domain